MQEAETKFVNHANMTIQEQVEIVKKKAGSQKRSFAGRQRLKSTSTRCLRAFCQVASVMDKCRAPRLQSNG